MKMLHYLARQSWRLLLLAAISGILGGLSGAALVAVVGNAIGGTTQVSTLAWLFFGLCLAQLVFKCCSDIALLHLTQRALFRLRVSLSNKLLGTPLAKLQSLDKHGLLAILTKDIETFGQSIQLLPIAFGNGVVIVACVGYVAWLSWQLFLIFVLFLCTCMVGFHLAERRPLRILAKVRDETDALFKHFRDLVEGSKELQLNAQRARMFIEQVITPTALRFKTLFSQSMGGYIWVANIGASLFYFLIGIFLFVVPLWFPQPAYILSAMTLTLLYLVRPISELMAILPMLGQASVSLYKIVQLEHTLTDNKPTLTSIAAFAQTAPLMLEFKGVCHHYPGDVEDSRFMLGPIDFCVHEGEIVFVIGGNGSGKTTLAMLLLGLYAPEKGELLLNHVQVTDANRESYRQHFSAVFADFHLFEQLLDVDQQDLSGRAEHYIHVFEMAHKVKVVDGKLSTIKLSTGQRKRLALVASYLEDRPFYLFDEWAADQDPAFKRVFYTELLPELKARGKTVVVITHDDGYFSCADRVVKLEDGHLKAFAV